MSIIRAIGAAPLLALAACATSAEQRVATPTQPVEVQIIALNDFHGNLEAPRSPVTFQRADGTQLKQRMGGVEALAATVQRLRGEAAHSITVSAGDLIGASPLVSAYFLDEPTVHAMNAIGLELNAVGNHEFDKGGAELRRMQRGGCEVHSSRTPCQLEQFGGADFAFLAANVQQRDGTTIFPGSAMRQFGPVEIGFIGMTLEDTGRLVTPSGVAGLTFLDEAESANALVPSLKAAGADAIVLLLHQGGTVTGTYRESGCDGLAGPVLDIIDNLDPAISVIVSGHTHYAYACELARGGAPRLLTSAGRYGTLVTDIRLRFDPATEALVATDAINVPVLHGSGSDARLASIVERYTAAAAPAAARVVGRLSGDAVNSETDGESPAARLIADAQLAATQPPEQGGADLALMNVGGVRTSLTPAPDGSVTYGQIFAMQPFGNNLVVKSLTGAQLKALLEQQFVTTNGETQVGALLVPSANFRFAYDLSRPAGERIVSMLHDGRPVDPTRTYRVTVNSFLASGGDGFTLLAEGTGTVDAGLDLDALESYLRSGASPSTQDRTESRTP